jgi:hypothetical protein
MSQLIKFDFYLNSLRLVYPRLPYMFMMGGLDDPYLFFHISSSRVKISLHTKNQLEVPYKFKWVGGVGWWSYRLLCHSQLELRLSYYKVRVFFLNICVIWQISIQIPLLVGHGEVTYKSSCYINLRQVTII